MPDAAPPLPSACLAGQPPPGALTPERIERALADFRDWLASPPTESPAASRPAQPVDLHTLVGQFTALRHEVNLQTKASRAALEQNAEALRQLEEAAAALSATEEVADEPATPSAEVQALVKAIVDIYDALALARGQIDKQRASIQVTLESVIESLTLEPPPVVAQTPAEEKPGFWARFLGTETPTPPVDPALTEWHRTTIRKIKEREQKAREACDFLRDALDSVLTGYTMSLNRVDRALEKLGVEPMSCVGERFDPERMEVIEAVPNSGRQLGEVLDEVRRGYYWNGAIFRYAQVRVAR
jgi:molecular chaperone GrpE